MTLGNRRELGVRHLIASCLDDACRHTAPETPVPWFRSRVKCVKCGGKQVDVRPNWKEMPVMATKLRYD